MSIQSADEILLQVNVSYPLEYMVKAFLKRLKYWLIARQTPIEEGDCFMIPLDILLEFSIGPYYSRETPIATVLSTTPKGNVWVNANTSVSIDFKPSGPAPVVTIRATDKEPPLEKHPLWSVFIKEIGFALENYPALDVRRKSELTYAFRLWLASRGLKKKDSGE